jgi:hypothetical protein
VRYAGEFFRRVFGNPALDAVGAVLILAGALLGVAGITLAPWLSALAVVIVLFYGTFRAFREVAQERDAASASGASRQQLVSLLAEGRRTSENYLNELGDVIALGNYDATFEPIEAWWSEFLDQVSELSPVTAAQLGSRADIDSARRPVGATQGNMNLVPLRSFLESRVTRISAALNTPQ